MSPEPKQPGAPVEQLLPAGRLLDHYRVIRLIGRGGMGDVYLARDTKLGRKVALKVIRAKALGDGVAASRFVQEARVTARFNHPNIVTIYGVGDADGSPYVALEYLEGQDLHERLSEQRPRLPEALRIACTVAEALAEAHRHDVLHRDLKPENVLMASDGRLRVLDFGLAKLVGEAELRESGDHPLQPTEPTAPSGNLAQTGTDFYDTLLETQGSGLRGTPLYMSPEQWSNAPLTPATDIFALGLMLHELFTGRHPLVGLGFIDLCNRVLDPNPLSSVGALGGLPDALVTLVDRCLDKDPTRRPRAAEVATGLATLAARDRPASAQENNPFRGLLPFTEQNADSYYGREPEVAAFVERLRVEPVLPVAGPSGAGKSSFVQAGVIPRLKEQGRWLVIRLRPGRQPFHSLALRFTTRRGSDSAPFQLLDETQLMDSAPAPKPSAEKPPDPLRDSTLGADMAEALAEELRQAPTRLALRLSQLAEQEQGQVLLFVDQLEELYSLVEDAAERRAFMEAICSAADDPEGPVRVIFTLRDDFLGRLAEGPEARQALGHITVLRSPEPEVLAEILRRPVKDRGYAFEDDRLVSEMVREVATEAAALPLLQFAGHRLWEQRDREKQLLRRTAYDAMGGVAGALIQHTDQVLEGLSPEQERMARELFLRLITPDSTRRVVPRSQLLDGLDAQAQDVLERLTEARILLVRKGRSEAELELVHESLVTVWDRFQQWIEESREERVFLHELDQAVTLWEKRGRRAEEVWTGDALRDAQRMASRINLLPEPLQRFLSAGAAVARRRVVRRRFLFGLGIFLLVAIALGAVVVSVLVDSERRVANRERRVANTQRDRAESAQVKALAESARAAMLQGSLVEARAKIRRALELQDSDLARGLWWRLNLEPLQWRIDVRQAAVVARISPDNSRMALAMVDGTIRIIDLATQQVDVLRTNPEQIYALTFGHDSNTLISGDRSGRILVWDIRARKAQQLKGHTRAIRSLHVQPGGHLLASGSSDKSVRLWNLRTRKQVRLVESGRTYVGGVRFSPDGQTLAVGYYTGEVRLWEVRTGKLRRILKRHIASVKGLAFSPDGLHLASGATDGTILVWEVATGKVAHRLEETSGNAYGLKYSPDGKLIASGHSDGIIYLWDAHTGRLVRRVAELTGGVYGIDFSRDGRYLAAGSLGGQIRLWRVAVIRRPPPSRSHTENVLSVAVHPTGKLLVTGSRDKTIRLWDPKTGRVKRILTGHERSVVVLAMQPGGRFLASSGLDRTVRFWDMTGGYAGQNLNTRMGQMTALQFSPDGRELAMAGQASLIWLFDTKRPHVRHRLKGHTSNVIGLYYSPDGAVLASTSADRTVRLWDPRTGKPLRTITGFAEDTQAVVFTPDGRHLLVSSANRTVYRIPVQGGSPQPFVKFSRLTSEIDISPNGRTLGVGLANGSASLVDLKTRARRTLTGHLGHVNAVRFDPSGRWLATVGTDSTVRLWSTATATPIWRAPLLSASTLELFSHRGVEALGSSTPPGSNAQRWRRAVLDHARLAAESPGGSRLCLYTHDSTLERWNRTGDKRLWSRKVPGVTRLLATREGCVTLAAKKLAVHRHSRPDVRLADNVSTAAMTARHILAVRGTQLLRFNHRGERQGDPIATNRGATAVARLGPWFLLGYNDGTVERLHHRTGQQRSTTAFEEAPPAAITRILAGPRDTVLLGFADGTVGLWSAIDGALIRRFRLHGSVTHLIRRQQSAYASTDLGQHLTLDLSLFERDRCAVLREIWSQVKVSWRNGRAQVGAPDPRHPCHLATHRP